MSFTTIRSNTYAALSRVMLDRINRRAARNMLALSSGKRINSTEDDAAGFALARDLKARKAGLQQAMDNIGNAQSLLNIAAGSHQVIVDNLSRIRDLVLVGADDAYNVAQRNAIQGQINALIEEMDDTVDVTNFQGKVLLDGSFSGRSLQFGAEATDTFIVSIEDVRISALGLAGIDVSNNAVATTSLANIDDALQTLFDAMQATGEILMRLDAKLNNHQRQVIALESSRSHIEDIEYGNAQYRMLRTQLIQQLDFNALNQAVVAPRQVLSLIVS
ncbi:MAG: hypothetical protein IIA59_01925 [Candidatus Marinimicrobia bacterium]|nr:hypothetical protein [Candidatus Neomarinimicrobiota bacterium]